MNRSTQQAEEVNEQELIPGSAAFSVLQGADRLREKSTHKYITAGQSKRLKATAEIVEALAYQIAVVERGGSTHVA